MFTFGHCKIAPPLAAYNHYAVSVEIYVRS